MRELEQRTTRVLDPEVSTLWLQDNALWLIAAVLVGIYLWRRK